MQFPVDNFSFSATGTTQVRLAGNIAAIELVATVGSVLRIDYRGPSGVANAVTYVTITVTAGASEILLDTADYLAGYYDLVLTNLPSGSAELRVNYQSFV